MTPFIILTNGFARPSKFGNPRVNLVLEIVKEVFPNGIVTSAERSECVTVTLRTRNAYKTSTGLRSSIAGRKTENTFMTIFVSIHVLIVVTPILSYSVLTIFEA
jgi:hypothetical protein